MKSTQPNFEIFKQCIVRSLFPNQAVNGIAQKAALSVLGREFKTYHLKIKDLEKEVNVFLDNLDIRQVPFMVNNVKEVKYPKWIREGRYIIDYNRKGFLDLIKI